MEGLIVYLQPRYLVFEIPFIVSVIMYLLQFGDAHDHDFDHDVDHDVDHEVAHGAHHHVGEHDSDHSGHPVMGFFTVLGLGKVPLSFVMSTFFILWGSSGWLTLFLIELLIPIGWISFLPAVAVASVVSFVGTSRLSSILAKFIPKLETYGVSLEEHVGYTGTARFRITESSGSVQFYDRRRSFQEVEARVKPGAMEIPRGEEVVLIEYNPGKKLYYVLNEQQYQTEFLGISE